MYSAQTQQKGINRKASPIKRAVTKCEIMMVDTVMRCCDEVMA